MAEHRIRLDEIDRTVDLCEACLTGFLAAVVDTLGDLTELGQAYKGSHRKHAEPKAAATPAQPALPSGRRPRTAPDPADRSPCPFCPAMSSSHNGLKQHIRTRHGLTWSQYQAGQAPTRGTEQQQELEHGAA